MLASLFSKAILYIHFMLKGGNNVWIPSNVLPLGCYSPFDVPYSGSQTEDPQKIGFSSCVTCLTNFVLVRGSQCICIDSRDVTKLIPVSDSYCDIRCTDGIDPDMDPLYCGGNLGGNLYCNKLSEDACLEVNANRTSVDVYRHFDDRTSVEECLHLGCGGRPDFFNPVNMSYFEYFPNLNPKDCITYCSFERTSYAHAGWLMHTSASNKYLYPSCACSNVTRPMNPAGPPCRNGTCWHVDLDDSIVLDGTDETLWCGNQDTEHDNWSVYCTTAILKRESDNTTYCAPFQATTLSNNSLDICVTPTSGTPKMSSQSVVTTKKPDKGCLKNTQRGNVYKEGESMGFRCQEKCENELCCLCGPCGNTTSCYYEGSCYDIGSESSDSSNLDDIDLWRDLVASKCSSMYPGGHLVAIETQNEQQFISNLLYQASEDKPAVMTSGVMVGEEEFYWSLSSDVFVPIDDEVEDWEVDVLSFEECSRDSPCYLVLSHGEMAVAYNVWRFTRCYDSHYYICEYSEPITSTTTTTSTTSLTTTSTTTSTTTTTTASTTAPTTSTTLQIPDSDTSTASSQPLVEGTTTKIDSWTTAESFEMPENCPCVQTDVYNFRWVIPPDETQVQPCRSGATGNASWTCEYIVGYGCRLSTPQPDYSGCHSQELDTISIEVEEANSTLDLYQVWETLHHFTSPNDTYFGHEIDSILNIILDLLDQQDKQMNGTAKHLALQINTTQTGTYIIDNLISHDIQWNQISNQNNRSQSAIFLVNVAEEMSFRLVDVAESDGRSLRCETRSENVTISSSYWNGNQTFVDDCDLDVTSRHLDRMEENEVDQIAQSELFRRFPLSDPDMGSSYLLLPEGAVTPNQIHKAAGVLISQNILQHLFPGQNNVAGANKQIDSPMISYTLRKTDGNDLHWSGNVIPDGSFVKLVFRHGILAKDPPVRIVHRSLHPNEIPSAVIGSSFCVFMSYNVSNQEPNGKTWIWDGRGCKLESTNRTHTVCECSHLTGFASLMDFHDYTGESRPLEITSLVCSTASAICLAVTFIVLTALRSIKTDRTIITQNLCIFLMLSHLLALTTLNRNYFNLDDATCAAMGVLLHFSLLVSFMWMGIEGLRLCRMVVYVFNLNDWTVYYVLVSYIVPFLIVTITVMTAYISSDIISIYAGDETCWLNGGNYKWSFAGPVALIILVNLIFVIIAVRSSWNLKQNTDRKMEEKIRNAAALALSLTCLLGISWLTGFFLLAETQVFAYIFTITNGLQGVSIMLFRCVLNDEVGNAIKERWRRHQSNQVGRWSSMMTNNTTSQRGQSVIDVDGRMRTNKKLAQSNSQLSIGSGSTKTTDVTDIRSRPSQLSQRGPKQRNIRTFSGTEFSDEFSSEISESVSTTSDSAYRQHSGRTVFERGAQDSRRVSFLIQNQETTSHPHIVVEDVKRNEHPIKTWGKRENSNTSSFREQDSSAFF